MTSIKFLLLHYSLKHYNEFEEYLNVIIIEFSIFYLDITIDYENKNNNTTL